MKKNILFTLIISALVMLNSCGEDFLYISPQGSVDHDFLMSQTGVDLLATNAYANFSENGWGASITNWTFGSMYGGDANKGSDANDQSVLNTMETYSILPTNSYVGEKYTWVYKGAKRVNITMQTIALTEGLPDAFKNSRLGEMYFLRAVFYFEGIRVFGPFLPWVDDTNTDNNPLVHNDVDIYPNVLADIDQAITLLPEKQDVPGRPNSWAAKALKAKVLMHRGDLAAAKPILKDVIDNGITSKGEKYALVNNMHHNFYAPTDNGPESIFGIQFSHDTNNANPGMSLNYPHGGDGSPGGCCGFFQPSNELANSFKVDENGLPLLDKSYRDAPYVAERSTEGEYLSTNGDMPVDPRLDFAIGRFGIPYRDWGLPKNNWVRDVANGGFLMPKKHVYTKEEQDAKLASGGIYDGWAPGSAINYQYLSLRDIILLYAEALANDGDLSGAMGYVNQIRTRAANPANIIYLEDGVTMAANYSVGTYPASHATFSDKDLCIEAIRMERKLELAMEGHRWFDLARWGGTYMANAISEYVDFEKAFITKFASSAKLDAAKTMFPLPDSQIQTMGNDEDGNPYLVQPGPWK